MTNAGRTRGWEVFLSHEMKTGITTGFCKATSSSDLVDCLKDLQSCACETMHPMLLPIMIFSREISFKTDIKQWETRDWLRKLEHAVSLRSRGLDSGYLKNGAVDLDLINEDLVECHVQVLWRWPMAYLQIIESFKETMELVEAHLPEARWGAAGANLRKIRFSISSRLEFYNSTIWNWVHSTCHQWARSWNGFSRGAWIAGLQSSKTQYWDRKAGFH